MGLGQPVERAAAEPGPPPKIARRGVAGGTGVDQCDSIFFGEALDLTEAEADRTVSPRHPPFSLPTNPPLSPTQTFPSPLGPTVGCGGVPAGSPTAIRTPHLRHRALSPPTPPES